MDERKIAGENEEVSFKDKYSLPIFITISVILAANLVAISMAIYNSSGAAQLDLSRPGYVSVRSQASNDSNSLKTFSASGSIDRKVIEDYKTIYNTQITKVKTANAFSGDPLSPSSLGMEVPTDTPVTTQ